MAYSLFYAGFLTVEAKLCTRFPAKSSTATTNQCKHPACASCLLALLSWHDILSTDSTMAEVTSLQKICYALWEYDSTKRERLCCCLEVLRWLLSCSLAMVVFLHSCDGNCFWSRRCLVWCGGVMEDHEWGAKKG
jgi:hypothetical protein